MDINVLLKNNDFNFFIFNNITSAIFLADENLKIQKVNDIYKALFHRSEKEIIDQLCGNSIGCCYSVKENLPCGTTSQCKKCTLRTALLSALKKKDSIHSTYIKRVFYIDGKPVQKNLRISVKYVMYNNKKMAAATIDDITKLEEQKNKIKELAEKDYLTGLYNRRYLFDYGEKVFNNARRGYINLAVAMIDIDSLKEINDRYGHCTGDFILKSISDILKKNLRKSDIISRFGGEDFCILLNTKEKEDAFFVIDKMRQKIADNYFIYQDEHIPVTISCGITCSIENTLETTIKKADSMLYRSKFNGKNRTTKYLINNS